MESGNDGKKRCKKQKDEEDKVSKRLWPSFRQSNQSVEETSNRSEASLSLLDNHESLVRIEEEQNVDKITENNVLPPDLEKLEGNEISNIPMPDVIKQHDLGVISFCGRGKPVIPESIRTEMTNPGSKHFQNMEGPFFPIKNRSMNKSWFHKKLGDGRGE